MGAVGVDPFENDLAMDLLDELRELDEGDVIIALESALTSVLDVRPNEYLDRDLGEPAVAASAIVVAKALGRDSILEDAEILDAIPELPASLTSLVEPALRRVAQTDSEVLRLWIDAGRENDWKAVLDNLSREASALAGD